ncbi:WD40 domain-containing protein [Pseudomassariella vexata]|uniref:WD40 domain-containing protein n=1 Tax=Pseudomassariella vexata TaxID=1141098 RepID=A0A1Y2EDQ2_9PEZI|nr:WD40 domain-containing protein [Pseudomassariella vexata]ORY69708.1 WD40 domain-containing protein [Pseudomassariella vexata]
MRFSPVFKSSPHCLPSPDGTLIATLFLSSISIRAVASLATVRSIKLPADLVGVTAFIWSPSSKRLLLAASDQIHVFSATGGDYHAIIRNPSSSTGKSTFVDFGATDDEACVYSAFGIKLSIFNLASSRAVEINNPKFYNASTAARGFSFRPRTHHLALLTRTTGRDTISIHAPGTREVQRSWNPDTIDASGLSWTSDGSWLIVWESAAQGHRLLSYTSDGHLFQEWCGPRPHAPDDMDLRLGAGIRFLTFSPNGQFVAAADSSRCVYLLYTATLAEHLQLCHPLVIEPRDTLQIWQEQRRLSNTNVSLPTFLRTTRAVSPPARPPQSSQSLPTGGENAQFDSSSSLLATKLEEAPTTVWIWDVAASELRATLIFHSHISRVDWHPVHPELLFIKCEGPMYGGVVFVWDPLSDGPRPIDFRSRIPDGKISGRVAASWLRSKSEEETATVFFADNLAYLLGSPAESGNDIVPWQAGAVSVNQDRSANLPSHLMSDPHCPAEESDAHETDMVEDVSDVDDTFHFKRNS